MNRWPTLFATVLLLTAGHADAASTLPGTAEIAGDIPAGLKKEDWSSIRAAHEQWRHSFMPVEGGWQAQNPGQQWTTRFDDRGFLTTPKNGGWTWGLELQAYGAGLQQVDFHREGVERTVAGQRLNYRWNEVVEEWWINDRRGLEHGFTIASRPPGKGGNLWLLLATGRGILPVPTTTDGRFGLSLRRYTDRIGITLSVETADSIAGPWTSIASSVNGGPFTGRAVIRETGSGVARDVRVQSPDPFPAPFVPGKFLRLHVSP